MQRLWQAPHNLTHAQPPLTNAALAQAERQLGVRLPPELIALLRQQNGGAIRYQLDGTPQTVLRGIGSRFGALTDLPLEEYRDWVDFSLDALVPLDGDGHWFVCLDYRDNKQRPCVSYIDTECNLQRHIANDFVAYLQLLRLPTDGLWVIKTRHGLAEVADQVQQALEVPLACMDFLNLGRDSYRGKYRNHLIELSPNQVPACVQDDDAGDVQAVGDALALRYPELDASDVLLQLYAPAQQAQVLAELRETRLQVRTLAQVIDTQQGRLFKA